MMASQVPVLVTCLPLLLGAEVGSSEAETLLHPRVSIPHCDHLLPQPKTLPSAILVSQAPFGYKEFETQSWIVTTRLARKFAYKQQKVKEQGNCMNVRFSVTRANKEGERMNIVPWGTYCKRVEQDTSSALVVS